MTDTPRFAGVPAAAFDFWEGLAADNTKSYWQAHKSVYESAVKEPVAALADALVDEFGEIHVFRPYRDVRFSKDKTPYQLFASLAGRGATGGATLYMQLGLDGMLIAGGYYQPPTATLTRFREKISDPAVAAQFDGLHADLTAQGYLLEGNELRTAPKGWDRHHPRIDLLRLRNLAFTKLEAPGPWLSSPECLTRLSGSWRELERWNAWLVATVGPPDEAPY